MQLLLVLSALLTGLTGLIGGERAIDAQQLERSAIAAAAVVDAATAVVQVASEAAPLAAPVAHPAAVRVLYAAFVEPTRSTSTRVDERRLE